MKTRPILLALFATTLILGNRCGSCRARQAIVALPAADREVLGANTALQLTDASSVRFEATARELRATVGIRKNRTGTTIRDIKILFLDAQNTELTNGPCLKPLPADLENLNDGRPGEYEIRFRVSNIYGTRDQTSRSEESRTQRRTALENPLQKMGAARFLLVAETAANTQTGGENTENPIQTNPSTGSTVVEIVERAEPAVFIVYRLDETGEPNGMGTGFFIGEDGTGVSNHHVFDGGTAWVIQTFDGSQYPVTRILKSSPTYDHVVFEVNAPNGTRFRHLQLSAATPKKGEDILVLGNPHGLESTLSRGSVSSLRAQKHPDDFIQIDAAISPGSSGSPVLNLRGEVVGIATLKVLECENCNMAYNIKVLQYPD